MKNATITKNNQYKITDLLFNPFYVALLRLIHQFPKKNKTFICRRCRCSTPFAYNALSYFEQCGLITTSLDGRQVIINPTNKAKMYLDLIEHIEKLED